MAPSLQVRHVSVRVATLMTDLNAWSIGIAASVKYGTAIAADILSVKVFGGTPPEDEESDSEDEESDSEDGYSDSDDEGDEATAEEIEAHDNMLRAQAARIAMAICDVADEHEAQRDNEE